MYKSPETEVESQALTEVLPPTDDTLTLTLHEFKAKLEIPSAVYVDADPTSTQVVPPSGDICNFTVAVSQVPATTICPSPLLKLYVELLEFAETALSTLVKDIVIPLRISNIYMGSLT